MFLQKFPNNSCCLCGSSEKLTGEHKIKASALREEFGKEPLVVGVSDSEEGKLKSAQSTNSKHLKFSVLLCEACNTSRTQQADREFDRFNQIALDKIESRENPMTVFELKRYSGNSEPYLNVFRYFAKLLSCHMAEVSAPIPIRLALFAVGETDLNCIWLELKNDPSYDYLKTLIGDPQYAAHGGLVVYGDKNLYSPNAFHSTLTIGQLQYVFFMRLSEMEKIELMKGYPDFFKWCRAKMEEAKESPLSENTLLRLGLRP